jgi:hypothetical protein
MRLFSGIVFLVFFSITAQSQTAGQIAGYWKFKEVANAEKHDSTALKTIREMAEDLQFHFMSDRNYKLIFPVNEEGTWAYDETTKKISLQSKEGGEMQLDVSAATDTSLTIGLTNGTFITLKKTSANETAAAPNPAPRAVYASATVQQLCKKWQLKKLDVSGVSADIMKEVQKDMDFKLSIQFSQDQKFKLQSAEVADQGTWKFVKENKSIITQGKTHRTVWNIHSINDKEMVLSREDGIEIWIFSIAN